VTTVYAGTFRAMGCGFRVCVSVPDPQVARAAVRTARQLAEELEAVLSRFRDDSELSRLNRAGGGRLEVHPVLWAAVRWALWAAHATGGLYDPTVLDRLQAAGYAHSFDPGRQAGPLPPPTPAGFGRWRLVRAHPRKPVVEVPPGVQLDLGGVGKALAAERIAARLSLLGPCLVEAGGDLAVRGVPRGWPGWPVAVEGPSGPVGVLWVDRGGVATSGTTVRRWRAGSQLAHHLIDPRTGLPARTRVATATVWARNAVEANAHSLALVVAGTAGLQAYLAGRRHLRAMVVLDDGAVAALGLSLHTHPPGEAIEHGDR